MKIWQRYPNASLPACGTTGDFIVSGPGALCPGASDGYWLDGAVNSSTYTWSADPGLSISPFGNQSAWVTANSSTPPGEYAIRYTASDPACNNAVETGQKYIYVGKPDPAKVNTIVLKNISHFPPQKNYPNQNYSIYYLHAEPNSINAPANTFTYSWDITSTDFTGILHKTGATVYTSPSYNVSPGVHTIDWTLYITNACGTTTKTGHSKYLYKTTDTANLSDPDPTNYYFTAIIPDTAFDNYFNAVEARKNNLYMPDTADSIAVAAAFAKIELEEFAPYLVTDDTYDNSNSKNPTSVSNVTPTLKTSIAPNPTKNTLTVTLGNRFVPGNIDVSVLDIYGRVQQHELKSNTGGSLIVDCSGLPQGVYVLSLQQNSTTEKVKFVKD